MKLFKKKPKYQDNLEEKLNTILVMTKDLGRKEFNYLIDVMKYVFEARQKLKYVKTEDEKETAPVDKAEKILSLEEKWVQ